MKDILEQIYEELDTVGIMEGELGLVTPPVASILGKLIRKAIKQAKLEVIESMTLEEETECDCNDLKNCKWTKGYNNAVQESRFRGKDQKELINTSIAK